jgi:hypothetical protein
MKFRLLISLSRLNHIKEARNESLNILSLWGLVGVTLVEQPSESRADIVNVSFIIDDAVDWRSSKFDRLDV